MHPGADGSKSSHDDSSPSVGSRAAELSRRRLLYGSAVVGGFGLTAGCLDGASVGDSGDDATVFVFNTADKTVSLIDAATRELRATTYLGATASFPSNQYAPRTTDSTSGALWLNVGQGVRAVDPTSLDSIARVDTGSGSNWLEHTPPDADAQHVVVSAREPAHEQLRIDADPDSNSFGEVTARIDRSTNYDGPRDGPGPCDVTLSPDGAYAYVLDVFASTLTVLDVDAFEVASQVDVEPVVDGVDSANAWMGTASWDGQYLVVENDEGVHGTEGIWDVSDPESPEELVRLTADDDLGAGALTNEIGPESQYSYVLTPGSNDVSVVDIENQSVERRIDLGGTAYAGTWDPAREYLYVPVQSENVVKVIDAETRELDSTVPVGGRPYGATAARVRPAVTTTDETMAALASFGAIPGGEKTYCIGDCQC